MPGPTRRPRCLCVDLDDKAAHALLSTHVKAADVSTRSLFAYSKGSQGQAPGWAEIWRGRHLLMDLVAATRGRLLRMARWERQLQTFLAEVPGAKFSADEISLVARRPRLMLSHLWNAKRDEADVPKKFAQLKALVDAMDAQPRRASGDDHDDHDDDNNDSCNDSGDDVEVMLASQVSIVSVASTEASHGDADIDKLCGVFLQESSGVAANHASPGAATNTSPGATALSLNDIAILVGDTSGSQAPSATDYKDMYKRPAARKRPAAHTTDDQNHDDNQNHDDQHHEDSSDDGDDDPALVNTLRYDDEVSLATNRKRIHSRACHTERVR